MRQCKFAAAILTAWFVLSAGVSAQKPGDPDVVKQVLDAWQKRREAIKTVRYKVEGVEIYPKGSMTEDDPKAHERLRKDFPPEDVSFPAKIDYTFDFSNRRLRKERHYHILHQSLGEFCPHMTIEFFDGKKATRYEPRAENTSSLYTPVDVQPDLVLYKGSMNTLLSLPEYPLLFAHGYPTVYCRTIDMSTFFNQPIDSSLFRFHGRGKIGDRDCVIIRTVPNPGKYASSDEFWVDLARDGAVLRWQSSERGTPDGRQDISYRLIDGHWLPESWQFDLSPLQDDHPVLIRGERMKVTEIQIDPKCTDETFSAPRKHGMVVSDSQLGVFVVASDNRTLVPYGQPTHVWRWWHWFGITILCGAFLGVFVFWLRFRSHARS